MPLTIMETLAQIRRLDLCATYNAEYNEFRVAYPSDARNGDKGYYTSDRNDAIATAQHMARIAAISTDVDTPCATE